MNIDTLLLYSAILDFFKSISWNMILFYSIFLCFLWYLIGYLRKKYRRSDKFDLYKKYETTYQVCNIISINELPPTKTHSIAIELDIIAEENTGMPLPLYTILNLDDNKFAYDIIHNNQHAKFLLAYRNQRWDMAITIGNSLKTSYNGCLKQYYQTMINRCQYYKKHPPGNAWDGIWS